MNDDDPDHQPVAVVLAAGKGARFGSATPKVLQPLAGRPLVGHVLATLAAAGLSRAVLVVGYGADQVRAAFPNAQFALQAEQRGTGHALLMARDACADATTVVLVYGDVPLIEAPTIEALVAAKRAPGIVMAAVTCDAGDTTGMGRIVRDPDGRPLAVVEEKVATAEQKAITEWNVGLYAFDAAWLWPRLAALTPSPVGEIYLTDLFAQAAAEQALATVTIHDPTPAQGINTWAELARAEAVARERARVRLLASGVLLISPQTSVIDVTAQVGRETVIYPGSVITGETVIGAGCHIGPHAVIANSRVGDGCRIGAAWLDRVTLAPGTVVAPYTTMVGPEPS